MDTLVGGHFESANSLCDSLNYEFPGHPAATYARIACLYSHMIDREDTVGRGEFMALIDLCTTQCDQWKPTGQANRSELAFLKGSALAARGLILHHEGKTLSGLKSLISSKNQFDDAIEADPQFYDAYLGRGAYRYGLAQNASLVNWLPFIPSAKSGWRDLWLAVNQSAFSKYAALTSIVWFVLDDHNYSLADSICTVGLERFPGSRNFLWPRLSLLERQKDWANFEILARQILDQYLTLPDNNGYETTGLYWRLMRCADELNRPEDAALYAQAGIATFRTADAANRRQNKLNELKTRLAKGASLNK
jgi:hypothetical protein